MSVGFCGAASSGGLCRSLSDDGFTAAPLILDLPLHRIARGWWRARSASGATARGGVRRSCSTGRSQRRRELAKQKGASRARPPAGKNASVSGRLDIAPTRGRLSPALLSPLPFSLPPSQWDGKRETEGRRGRVPPALSPFRRPPPARPPARPPPSSLTPRATPLHPLYPGTSPSTSALSSATCPSTSAPPSSRRAPPRSPVPSCPPAPLSPAADAPYRDPRHTGFRGRIWARRRQEAPRRRRGLRGPPRRSPAGLPAGRLGLRPQRARAAAGRRHLSPRGRAPAAPAARDCRVAALCQGPAPPPAPPSRPSRRPPPSLLWALAPPPPLPAASPEVAGESLGFSHLPRRHADQVAARLQLSSWPGPGPGEQDRNSGSGRPWPPGLGPAPGPPRCSWNLRPSGSEIPNPWVASGTQYSDSEDRDLRPGQPLFLPHLSLNADSRHGLRTVIKSEFIEV